MADVSVAPWPVPAAEHTLAITKWPNNRQPKKADLPKKLPFRAWLMYRMRFIFAADICGAWLPFGGLSDQLSNFFALLHLSTTGNIATAMAYDALLSANLAESARARAARTVGAVDFADLLSTGRARFKIQAVAQCVRTPNIPPVDKKPDTNRTWLPKKEYLKLAADEAASADQSQPSSPNRGRMRSPGRKRSRSPSSRQRSTAKGTRQEIPETEITGPPPVAFLEVPKATNDTWGNPHGEIS